ncbi:MAG: hypothetical protein LH465_01400 [Sphingomonas bacterium]|nr:hypothetical protein [Sphingomonas bacterium]
MRFAFIAVAAGLLAACASDPKPAPGPSATPVTAAPHYSSDLIGMSAGELGQRLGQPRLEVREGDGTKVQYGAGDCVLDAYLYPPTSGGGAARVTHVDTRNREGRSAPQSACIAAIERR